MTTEAILLLLRIVSGLLLGAFLLLLFVALWRDYRSVAARVESTKRSYGRLLVLLEVDNALVKTGQSYPLLPLTSLGRAPTNTIIITDSFASSEHASIALRSGQWWLEDRGSRNGTTLNGVPVTQPTIITDGDIIGIGNMRLQLELQG